MTHKKFEEDFLPLKWKSLFIMGKGMGTTNFTLQLLDLILNQYKTEQTALFKQLFNLNSKVLYIKKNLSPRDNFGKIEISKIKEFNKIHPISFINYKKNETFDLLYEVVESSNFDYVIIDDVKLLLNHQKYLKLVELIEKKNINFIVGYNSSEPSVSSHYGVTKYMKNTDVFINLNVNIYENLYEFELSSYILGNQFTKEYSISLK